MRDSVSGNRFGDGRPSPTCYRRFKSQAGTAPRGIIEVRAVTRHRIAAPPSPAPIALLATGCMGMGGDGDDAADASLPAATAPAAVAAPVAVAPGHARRPRHAPAPDTPKDVKAALKGDDVIVVAFLNGNAADDAKVAAGASAARRPTGSPRRRRPSSSSTPSARRAFGDLADVLGVEGTPSVAVIGRDRNLTNLFTGLIDGDILRQAIWDAADTAAANADASVDREGRLRAGARHAVARPGVREAPW